jgi:hypothetical protein
VFDVIRCGAVWERSEGLGLLGRVGFGSFELVLASRSEAVSTLKPLAFLALGRGVSLGEGRALVTVAVELSDEVVVALPESGRLLAVPARWKKSPC